jgi:hypothetical protein
MRSLMSMKTSTSFSKFRYPSELQMSCYSCNHGDLTVHGSFMSKPRSPSRDRAQPLSPCLVRRQATSPSPSRPTPVRQSSLNMPPRTDVVTIPLRSCCNNCFHTTEESLREGIEWHEKFSRAARRRRSTSLDSSGFPAICEAGPSFSAKLAINVDEVEKRQKSHGSAGVNHEKGQSPSSSDSGSNRSPVSSSNRVEKVAPIVEEDDDDQLFPLPSPRRSPTSSPVPSPTASLSCLAASSRDSLPISNRGSTSSCEDSDSRVGKGRCTKGLLTPDRSPSIPPYVPQGLQEFPPSTPLSANLTRTRYARDAFPSAIPSSPKDIPRTPSSSPERRRHRSGFSLSTPSQLFKVGAEALKGVSVMSNGSTPLRI